MSCPQCGMYGALCDRYNCGRYGVPLPRDNCRARDEAEAMADNIGIFGLIFLIPYITFMFYYWIGCGLLSLLVLFVDLIININWTSLFNWLIFFLRLFMDQYFLCEVINDKITTITKFVNDNKLAILSYVAIYYLMYYLSQYYNSKKGCPRWIRHNNGNYTCI